MEKNDGPALLIVGSQVIVVLSFLTEIVENWSVWSHLDVVKKVLTLVISIFARSSLDLDVNGGLRLFQLSDVAYVPSGKGLLELLVHRVDHDLALEVLTG